MATALRDQLAISPRYVEYDPPADSAASSKIFYWKIQVVSLDPTVGKMGDSSVMAVVFLGAPDFFLNDEIQVCLRNDADECAREVLSSFDDTISNLK